MSAAVVLFPASRMVGRARRLVELRRTTPVAEMTRLWGETVAGMDRAMCRLGVCEEDRRREIDDFYDAVKAEIVRVDYEAETHGAPGSSKGETR